jgi:tripartite-type tricarboxylate transporter receptor subunit TctC
MNARKAILLIAAAMLTVAPLPAAAQDYPSRNVTVVAPSAPGGMYSLFARFVAHRLEQRLGQSFVVENRPAGAGNIGTMEVIKAAPDGYTLLVMSPSHATYVTLYEKLPYNTLRDIAPVAGLIRSVNVLVAHPSVPARTVPELIAHAKANPGKLNYGSVGVGSTAHLATALFSDVTGIQMQHVPYSQMAQGQTDLISGRTPIWFGPMGSSLPNIRANKARALAVTGPKRAVLLPEIPTMSELGITMGEESSWYGFFAPKGTPKAIIEKINGDLQKVIDSPDMREREVQLGYRFIGGPPEKLGAWVNTEIAKWNGLAKKGAFGAIAQK